MSNSQQRRQRVAMCALLLVTITASACSGASTPAPQQPATGEAAPPTTAGFESSGPDAELQAKYMAAIEANGGGVGAVSQTRLVALGQNICSAKTNGVPDDEVVALVRAEREGYTKSEATTIIKSARQVLCP